jgi:hypothetical protein
MLRRCRPTQAIRVVRSAAKSATPLRDFVTASSGPEPLQSGELIDDEALTRAGDDAFRLGDFVDELVALCERASAPVNVALFGAWGSGKSSLANLLEQRFRQGKSGAVVFARFDAFKYAGIALRRHLLSQLAESLGADGKKYGEDLYKSRNTNSYEMPRRDAFLRFVRLLLVALVAVGAVLAGAAAIVGLASDTGAHGAFGPAFRQTLKAGVPSLLFASGLVGTLLLIAGKTFTVESTQAPPSTDEQFGRLFAALVDEVVKEKRCERIVVFVDELDRCSPGQVVAVLETIKTFLHIAPCVFVVAADKQAIEQAIGEQARQATPTDSVNPYYSAGGAYLDKIFQHQLALPPLMPRTLSQFALRLIQDRPGAWQSIENKPELVTVLVPEHARSPRRVKVLLNAFLLAYRLALARAADGALDPKVATRASELAKLVCLQTEFPLFAAELRVDTQMAAATLALHETPGQTLEELELVGFGADSYRRALAYAEGRLPSDTVIAKDSARPPGEARPEEEDEHSGAGDPEHPELAATHAEDEGVESIVESQSRQLGAYLARTRKIPGPSRDLVMLESSGAAFGLPAELAERLDRAARNGLARSAVAAVAELVPEERPRALLLLCALAKDSIGLEKDNACRCLFAALVTIEEGLDSVVDEVLAALQTASDYQLTESDLPGALEVALLRRGPAALDLRRQVLSRDETRENEDLGVLILSRASELGRRERGALGPVLAARLLGSEPGTVFAAIADVSDGELLEMLAGELAGMLETLGALEPDEAAERAAAILKAALQTRIGVALPLLRVLLGLDSREARSAVEPLLGDLAPIDDEETISEVLAAARHRNLASWKTWLGVLDAGTVRSLGGAPTSLAQLTAKVLTDRFHGERPAKPDDASAAIGLLVGLTAGHTPVDPAPVKAAFEEGAQAAALDPEASAERQRQYELLAELAVSGLLADTDTAELIIDDLARTIQTPLALDESTQRLPARMLAGANLALAHADASESAQLVEAVQASGWLSGPTANAIVLQACSRQARLGVDVEVPLNTDDLREIALQARPGQDALASWISAFEPTPQMVYDVLHGTSAARRPATELSKALGTVAKKWSKPQREAFDGLIAEGFFNEQTGLGLIAPTRSAAPPEQFTVRLLSQLAKRAANNKRRTDVMALWVEFAPQSALARRTLISEIYEPLLSANNKGSVKIALDRFELVADPPSKAVRNKVRGKLKRAVKSDRPLRHRAEQLMVQAGWVHRGRLGRITDT